MKRNIFLTITIAFTSVTFAQTETFNDFGILLSKDKKYGTARYEAMSGAFGALGSDVSSISVNPAGAAVAIKSKFSVTLNNRSTNLTTSYYGANNEFGDNFFNISQAGGILSFTGNNSDEWTRFAFSFNYKLNNDFNNFYALGGNNNLAPTYNEHFNDNKVNRTQFNTPVEQYADLITEGETSSFSVGVSAVHQNKLFIGANLNFHNLEYYRDYLFNEINNDADGNTLDVRNRIISQTTGEGFSLSLGFIYKANQNLRLGLAYESPTWYQQIIEDSEDLLTMNGIESLDLNPYRDNQGPFLDEYRFRTPSRITASGAYIFGKKGLLSVDYTYRDYQNAKFRGTGLNDVNTNFSNNYRNTHALNIGTEWKFDRMSVRGGYHYEKDPNLLAGGNTSEDNVRGYSLGLGYNFGKVIIDLGYTKYDNTEFYSLYRTGDINILNNTSRISGTVTFGL